MGEIRVVPVDQAEAFEFIERFHRHHKPPAGDKFRVGVADDQGTLRGVAVVGRPVARMRDDGRTLEITRLCTDGTRNACSMLYAACQRAAFAMGYQRIGTYTLPSEGGASLKAAGWRLVGERGGGRWSRTGRERTDEHPTEGKWLWEASNE